ncbi:MAG TPA: amino acid--tRNA ligase-related protein, partial [Planctomycetaceae bacterium]|nr:amino acid--tRNA ligase-related protein [Planctomycetaceae bacterium]
AELVEPRLGSERPEFLYDYPASQAALAVVRPDDPPVAERFELYWRGIELCNGYHELRDPLELRRRIDVESQRRTGEGLPPLPLPGRFLQAMQSGLPDCAGVALGFDRLMMLATGAQTVRNVMPFAFEQA